MKKSLLLTMDADLHQRMKERAQKLDTDVNKYIRALIRKDLQDAKASLEIVTK